MGSIINLEQLYAKRKTDEIITLAALEALEQITQEINLVLHYLNNANVNLKATLPRVKDATKDGYFYMLSELCFTHGENLKAIGKAIDENTEPIDPGNLSELKRTINELPGKYGEGCIIGHCLDRYAKELIELDSI